MNHLIDRLAAGEMLNHEQLLALLNNHQDEALRKHLASRAWALREKHFGRKIFLRGLIEFTNYCRNDCLYCGLRRSNTEINRYRLSLEEILARCTVGYELDFRTFVLQGGEDPASTPKRLVEMAQAIKEKFPDCALTLSVGEHSRETYAKLRQAGADRYLLRHETANPQHYGTLHPPIMTWEMRYRALNDLKELGFQVGAGFMVGSPGQNYGHLVQDLMFLKEFNPQMIGVGPFIPHCRTPFRDFPSGSFDLVLFILGLIRLILPLSLLPATTALGTVMAEGREKALEFGANVLMPNLSPPEVRGKYDIYAGKIYQDQEASEGVAKLKARLEQLGFEVPVNRGDFPG